MSSGAAASDVLIMDFSHFLVLFLVAYAVWLLVRRLLRRPSRSRPGVALPGKRSLNEPVSARVSALYVFPIKSCRGVALDKARVTRWGLQHDREFVVAAVNESDDSSAPLTFLSLRVAPRLSLVTCRIDYDDCVVVSCTEDTRKRGELRLSPHSDAPGAAARDIEVRVWDDILLGRSVSDEADRWFSDVLGQKVHLLRMSAPYTRKIGEKYRVDNNEYETSFTDGFPYLLTSTRSLEAVCAKAGEKLEMLRFRPNIVVDGLKEPFEEDYFAAVTIGDAPFAVVKAAERCQIPRMSLEDATMHAASQPTKALLDLGHQAKQAAYFGVHLTHEENVHGHVVSVGDVLQVTHVYDKSLVPA